MATSADQASLAGTGFGRLALLDGMLAYDSPGFQWRVALSDIKHVGTSKTVPNALEIESNSGQLYFVGILNSQLTMASPGKAVQMIQRAARTTVAVAAPTPTAAVSGGGGLR